MHKSLKLILNETRTAVQYKKTPLEQGVIIGQVAYNYHPTIKNLTNIHPVSAIYHRRKRPKSLIRRHLEMRVKY